MGCLIVYIANKISKKPIIQGNYVNDLSKMNIQI